MAKLEYRGYNFQDLYLGWRKKEYQRKWSTVEYGKTKGKAQGETERSIDSTQRQREVESGFGGQGPIWCEFVDE